MWGYFGGEGWASEVGTGGGHTARVGATLRAGDPFEMCDNGLRFGVSERAFSTIAKAKLILKRPRYRQLWTCILRSNLEQPFATPCVAPFPLCSL